MDAKDRKIARLEKQLAKQKMQESFVAQNLDSFDSLIDKLQSIKNDTGEKRYFGLRKGRPGSVKEGKNQVMFRLNLLVSDLIEYRARYNLSPENLAGADLKTLAVRLSQDTGTLITHLDKGRIKRTRKRSQEGANEDEYVKIKKKEYAKLNKIEGTAKELVEKAKRLAQASPEEATKPEVRKIEPAVTNFKVEDEEHLAPVTTKSGQMIMDQKKSGKAPPQFDNYKMDEATDKLADQPQEKKATSRFRKDGGIPPPSIS